MKQTAVKFIEEVLQGYGLSFQGMLEQAKAMHKEEIKNAWGNGWANGDVDIDYYESVQEQYYNETYGGNK